jgi:hypothetical protein
VNISHPPGRRIGAGRSKVPNILFGHPPDICPLTGPIRRTILDTVVWTGHGDVVWTHAAQFNFKILSPAGTEWSVQTSDSSSKAAERRQNPRTKLVEIAYIGMGPENGGLVLDVSEGGLSFHSVAPIQRD